MRAVDVRLEGTVVFIPTYILLFRRVVERLYSTDCMIIKSKTEIKGQSDHAAGVLNIKLMFLPQVRSQSTNLVQEAAKAQPHHHMNLSAITHLYRAPGYRLVVQAFSLSDYPVWCRTVE